MASRKCACPLVHPNTRLALLKTLRQARTNVNDDGSIIKIPVVVHLCFKTSHVDHYKNEVDWTLAELNKDFAKAASNFDSTGPYKLDTYNQTYTDYVSRAAATQIEFVKQDIRVAPVGAQSSQDLAVLDKAIKSHSPAVTPAQVLNLWVADLTSGILGYAQFPWELASKPHTDGVVIARGVFGRCASYAQFDLNKTATHEIGHWLGLYHTFQDTFKYDGGNINYYNGNAQEEVEEAKGDLVIDTPPQGQPTSGNPKLRINTWPTSKPTDETKAHRHMYMNFMDYSDDAALFMFTAHQAIKMRLFVFMYRPSLTPTFTGSVPAQIVTTTNTATAVPSDAIVGDVIWQHDFEKRKPWHLLGQATIAKYQGQDQSKALYMRRRGGARVKLDLSVLQEGKGLLMLQAKSVSSNATLHFRTANKQWHRYPMTVTGNTYGTLSFDMPAPFGRGYIIQLHAGRERTPILVDNLNITKSS